MVSKYFRTEAQHIFRENANCTWLTLLSGQNQRMYTFRDLEERINDYCAFYQGHNIREGDTVLIILNESLDLFASFFAAIIKGALPAYYAYPSPKQSIKSFGESIENLLKYNSVRLVIGFEAACDVLGSLNLSEANKLDVVVAESVPKSKGFAFDNVPPPKREAFLQFSSGTTGAKKGVKISVEALFNQLDSYESTVQFDEESRVISWLPHYHDMGLVACILMPFLQQVPVVIMSPFEWVKNPRILLDTITTYQGSHVWLPNFALGHLTNSIRSDELKDINLQSLKKIILCSEPVLYEIVHSFIDKFKQCGLRDVCLENCYAMAENTFAMSSTCGDGLSFLEVDQDLFRREHRVQGKPGGLRVACVGRPLKNISLSIVDECGHVLGENKVGEIWVQSHCMLQAYHNNPEATEDAMTDGWFKTGDLGFFHQGQLFVTGRKTDLMIIGGENIYPQDIELILNAESSLIPGRNVVFGIEDTRVGTEKIVVLAEINGEHEVPDSNQIRTKITNALNVAVAKMIFLNPRTLRKGTAGKISRRVNKAAYLEGAFTNMEVKAHKAPCSIAEIVFNLVPAAQKDLICEDTPLLSSGLIDSFGFVDLIQRLESCSEMKIPEELWQQDNFQTIACIRETLDSLRNALQARSNLDRQVLDIIAARNDSLCKLKNNFPDDQRRTSWVEWCINNLPFRGCVWYRWLFRMAGIHVGRNVKFLGRITVKFQGVPKNISIGDNVILGDGVDFRNRENGKIQLKERVYLDQNVRVVAARDGVIEIGFGTEIGVNTTINSGGMTRIGAFCMIAGSVNINSSSHGMQRGTYVKAQPHSHGFVELGDDVWVGSGASILMNTRIGNGAILSSNSLVKGEVPEFAICAGVPAKVIRYR